MNHPERSPQNERRNARSGVYPPAVCELIDRLSRLPGIGTRSAERLAFHVLKSDMDSAMGLASAIVAVKKSVRHCRVCFSLCDDDVCPICRDPDRAHEQVLVVEQPKDLIALEGTGMYRGVYHVLMGRLSAIDGIEPGDLTISQLFGRIEASKSDGGVEISEVVLGLNPTIEGDGTALYLAYELARMGVRITRLARGLPTGGALEYANKAVLGDAILGRQSMDS